LRPFPPFKTLPPHQQLSSAQQTLNKIFPQLKSDWLLSRMKQSFNRPEKRFREWLKMANGAVVELRSTKPD